ncbi:hypothetical protein [Chryseobacterium taiwanense]|uniref:Cytochrome c domain-containing protein n=1 Tax=Chryseobacterium taiwanense TaxID=363331 RepID=A0A0B4CUB9_9FLAO|nr:hypothetical protein [Chryseobacterium taiwanense]KIC64784.1 hypothetical protein RM51_02395 [Chryseobacterium taiwanense]
MNRILIIFILLFLTSCTKQENISFHQLEVGKVKFEYPSDWKLTKMQSIDSYFSYLSKNGDTICIVYGMYNSKIYKDSIRDNILKQITIDGKEAVFEISKNRNFASIYIPKVDSTVGLYMFNKKGNIQDVLDIYKTIKLGKSIRKTPLKFNFKENTAPNSLPGIVVYENNCLSCHSEFRYEIGPSLDQKFIQSKGKFWLKNYLYSKKKTLEYNIECSRIQKKDSVTTNELLKYLFQPL